MKKFAVIGNDARQLAAAAYLKDLGYKVYSNEEVSEADYILFPMPLNDQNISYATLLNTAKKGSVAFGGKVCPKAHQIAKDANIVLIDYLLRDDLAMFNAIPTVEGTIELIIRLRQRTIWSSNIIVTGYGRISKLICQLLKAFGAKVTVCARKASDRACAMAFGFKSISVSQLCTACADTDIIINTVPSLIITEQVIKNLKNSSLIIDLASVPGGVDFNAAKIHSKKCEWALSLPAKTAPITAGEFVVKTVLEIISEMEATTNEA